MKKLLRLIPELLLVFGCSDDPKDQYAPVTEACDSCLSGDATAGCQTEWLACLDQTACEDQAVCALNAHCYEESPSSDCLTVAGCEFLADAPAEAIEASQSFETCARTNCAAACDFAPP